MLAGFSPLWDGCENESRIFQPRLKLILFDRPSVSPQPCFILVSADWGTGCTRVYHLELYMFARDRVQYRNRLPALDFANNLKIALDNPPVPQCDARISQSFNFGDAEGG